MSVAERRTPCVARAGDAVVAPKQEGARGFYRRAAHAPKKLCFGGQIRRSRTRRVRKHPRGRPLPGRGVSVVLTVCKLNILSKICIDTAVGILVYYLP